MQARSDDGTAIHYDVTGDADTALVFVHGWMGNGTWWDAQRDAFAATHRIVQMDLGGHGRSQARGADRGSDAVRQRLMGEFSAVTGDVAAALLGPLYRCDLRGAAQHVRVPVRGIGTDLSPHDDVANRRYLADYAYAELAGYGHYPMLEAPYEFNTLLSQHL